MQVLISPFFGFHVGESLHQSNAERTCKRLYRALQEFRIRGVKTNIPFLENVIQHDVFQRGEATVGFIKAYPELFDMRTRKDRGTKILKFLGDRVVNGNPDVKFVDNQRSFSTPVVPDFDKFSPYPEGTKTKLTELGRDGFLDWLKANKKSTIY